MRSSPRVELCRRAQATLLLVPVGGSARGSGRAVDAFASSETSGLESGIRRYILLLLLINLLLIADVRNAVLISSSSGLVAAILTRVEALLHVDLADACLSASLVRIRRLCWWFHH